MRDGRIDATEAFQLNDGDGNLQRRSICILMLVKLLSFCSLPFAPQDTVYRGLHGGFGRYPEVP